MFKIFNRTPAPQVEAAAPQPRRKKRSYAGANQGRLFADFMASRTTADSELRASLEVLRDRSRDLVRNNEYARRFVNLMKTNVVGDRGFTHQVRARNLDNSLDAVGNQIIENAFKDWGRLGNCDVTGGMSWLDVQRFAIESLVRDGECFIRLVRLPEYKHSFSLQFIEADYIDVEKNGRTDNGEIRMGVEFNKLGRPVAYHVLLKHPNDQLFNSNPAARKMERIPADDIIHLYIPSRTHQSRGEPFMTPAIAGLKMLHGYREAELIAARAGAAKFGVITTSDGDEFAGDGETDDEVPIIDMAPGSTFQMPAGYDFKLIDPTHPGSQFAEFEQAVLRGVASGLNVSYTSLSNDLKGVSYSSIRQGTIEERDHYKTLQAFMIQHLCEPVFRAWLSQIMAFENSMPIKSDKYGKFADAVAFRGRGFAWVDPAREISAHVMALSNGIVSMNDVAANYGRDVEELFSQIQADKEMAERFGLETAFEPFGGGQSAYGPIKTMPDQPEAADDDN